MQIETTLLSASAAAMATAAVVMLTIYPVSAHPGSTSRAGVNASSSRVESNCSRNGVPILATMVVTASPL